ncbi:MAG: DUF362 domain-containing protein [Candidatus Aminicenantia bacterium]
MNGKVVIIKSSSLFNGEEINSEIWKRLIERGLQILLDEKDAVSALKRVFKGNERVGIKINTISGRILTTPPSCGMALSSLLISSGLNTDNIYIWDRTNSELKKAGYSLNYSGRGLKVFGTDTYGVGYDEELIEYKSIGSLFSKIQKEFINVSISLAILKDHGITGITGAMKNYYGVIHNPNKYHDGRGDPYIADLFSSPLIKSKHRIAILDASRVQYHRGPSYNPRYCEKYNAILISLDPVAIDYAGWRIIENIRKEKGLKSLSEEGREPKWIFTAFKSNIGVSDPSQMRIIEEEI